VSDYPDAFLKHAHKAGCDGALYRSDVEPIFTDRKGRVGNGGIVTYDYRCNQRWTGCYARVLVTERAVRTIAVSVEVRP
jgi:hypothetical protein